MRRIGFLPIGHVRSATTVDTPTAALQGSTSEIVLYKKYEEGLMDLDENELITVVFYFHRARGYRLRLHPRGDPSRLLTGVFNTRTQFRPNRIGITVARLKSIEGNRLVVEGLDAVDGTPVLDIKPHVLTFDRGIRNDDPRKDRTHRAPR